jgi:hypothetical protein
MLHSAELSPRVDSERVHTKAVKEDDFMTLTVLRHCAAFAFLLSALVACASAPAPPSDIAGVAGAAEPKRLQVLFDEAWEANMRRYPEWATYVGDHRYGDRLYDASPANEADAYTTAGFRHMSLGGARESFHNEYTAQCSLELSVSRHRGLH